MDIFQGGKVQAPEPEAPAAEPNKTPQDTTRDEVELELSLRPYKEYFGGDVDREQLDYLTRTLNPDNTLKPEEVVKRLRAMEAEMGSPDHPDRLGRLYRYIRLVESTRQHLLGGLHA
jgi:hypothetical protein